MLNLTPQERNVLAELVSLNNEYEALPEDKRAKFILSTDVRKEIREDLIAGYKKHMQEQSQIRRQCNALEKILGCVCVTDFLFREMRNIIIDYLLKGKEVNHHTIKEIYNKI